MSATTETYANLKALLDKEKFPKPYVFKFIILTDPVKESEIKNIFDEKAKITLSHSKSKKYTTVNILQNMESSEAIIDKYIAVSKIENVIHI
ncbi:DUF493 domain-containing protein [Putridiphycobacter roseus]|uniref:DUF493 domain-containing protein n=1 Tax=Putridiphycobacter roseus TaxID=2219161 RepID=A0A2W1N1I3_9FLAO|nr:DUF493 family protein [Putridiphycobacter roseus]PZE16801.1 DUF493 domain-containing protein [Putridiphycobacter roseus]